MMRLLIIGLLLAVLMPAALHGQAAPVDPAPAAPLVDALQRDLGIEISFTLDRYQAHTGRTLERRDQRAFLASLRLADQELRRHAPAFLANAGIRKLVFVRDLHSMQVKQAVAFNADTGALVLDALQLQRDLDYSRQMIHHELFHLAEAELSGSFWFADPRWLALNPPDSTYGAGGMNANRRAGFNAARLTHPSPGFINLYSRTGPEEDRAEIFATLFVPSDLRRVERWARSDEHLAAKLAHMRAYIGYWSERRDAPADLAYRALVKAMGQKRDRRLARVLERPETRRALDYRGFGGWTPLHWAAAHDEAVEALLIAGADPNAAADGWTPLHVAAFTTNGAGAAVRVLLQHGADPDVRDAAGHTAGDLAALRGCNSADWRTLVQSARQSP